MANFTRVVRAALAATAVVLVVAGCGMMHKAPPMVTLTTQMRAANKGPPVASAATGQVDGEIRGQIAARPQFAAFGTKQPGHSACFFLPCKVSYICLAQLLTRCGDASA